MLYFDYRHIGARLDVAILSLGFEAVTIDFNGSVWSNALNGCSRVTQFNVFEMLLFIDPPFDFLFNEG